MKPEDDRVIGSGLAVAILPLDMDSPLTVRVRSPQAVTDNNVILRHCHIGTDLTNRDQRAYLFLGDPTVNRFTTGFNTLTIARPKWVMPEIGLRQISLISESLIRDWLLKVDASVPLEDLDNGIYDYASSRLISAAIRYLLQTANSGSHSYGVVLTPDALAAEFYLPRLHSKEQTPHLLKLDWLTNGLLVPSLRDENTADMFDVRLMSDNEVLENTLPAFTPISENKLFVSRTEAVLTDMIATIKPVTDISAVILRTSFDQTIGKIPDGGFVASLEYIGSETPVEWSLTLYSVRMEADKQGDKIRFTLTPQMFTSLPHDSLRTGFNPVSILKDRDPDTYAAISDNHNIRDGLPCLVFDRDGSLLDAECDEFYKQFGFVYSSELARAAHSLEADAIRGAVAAAYIWRDVGTLSDLRGIEEKPCVSEKQISDSGVPDEPGSPPEGSAISSGHIDNSSTAYAPDTAPSADETALDDEFCPSLDASAVVQDYDDILQAAILAVSGEFSSCIETGDGIQQHMLPGSIYEPQHGIELFLDGSLTTLGQCLVGELLREQDDPSDVDFFALWEERGASFAAQLYTEFHLRKPFGDEDQQEGGTEEGAEGGTGDKQTGNADSGNGGAGLTPASAATDGQGVETQSSGNQEQTENLLSDDKSKLTSACKEDTEGTDRSTPDAEALAVSAVLDAMPGQGVAGASAITLPGAHSFQEDASRTDLALSATISAILHGLDRTEISLTDEDITAWAGRMMAYAHAVEQGTEHALEDAQLDQPVPPRPDRADIAAFTLAGCLFVSATAKALKAKRRKLTAGTPLTLELLRSWDWRDGLARAMEVIRPAAEDDRFDAEAVTTVVTQWHSAVVERISASDGGNMVAGPLAGLVVSYLLSAARDRVSANSERELSLALAALKLREIPFDALPEGWEAMSSDEFRAWASATDEAGSGSGASTYALETRAIAFFRENILPRLKERLSVDGDHHAVATLRDGFVSEAAEDPSLLSIDQIDLETMVAELKRSLEQAPNAPTNRSGPHG